MIIATQRRDKAVNFDNVIDIEILMDKRIYAHCVDGINIILGEYKFPEKPFEDLIIAYQNGKSVFIMPEEY